LLLLLSKPTAKFLVRLVIGEADVTKGFDEMETSVLKELGNIMGGTYISALSNFLSISIGLSPPSDVYDISDAIINQVVCLMSPDVEDVLFLKTRFDINSEKIDGKILIFTDSNSLTKMLEAINKLVGK
jgi:chemotaxis protein CheC